MAEPQIQYCTTSDDVSIAYYVMGGGATIVCTAVIYGGHLQFQRTPLGGRADMEAMERRHRVVRYDGRGSGLSQRESPDFSLAARLLDLEAVVDLLRLERFALFGFSQAGLVAVAYAARHPERVTHLILSDAYARGRDFYDTPGGRAKQSMRGLIEDQWKSYTLATSSLDDEFSDRAGIKELAARVRVSIEPDALLAYRDATLEIDVTDLLLQVRVPALVISRPSPRFNQPKLSQMLASLVPDARLAILGPRIGAGVDEQFLRAVEEFLGDAALPADAGEAQRAAATPRAETTAFRAVLFTDIVGHTEMMQRLGDVKGRDVLREHERITRELLGQHGGAEVKTMGDGFMASFGSVTHALDCAVALQRAFAAHTQSMPEPLHVRVGLNAGEPIEEEGDLFGSTVILASRIAAHAGAGEILVPDTVRGLLSGKNFVFADRGEFAMKGFDGAVRLYEVRWRPTVAAGEEGA